MEIPREKASMAELRAIKPLKKLDEQTLLLILQQIQAEELSINNLRVRIERYCARGILPVQAVERAIAMEQKNRFRKENLEEVIEQNGDFVQRIKMLNMDFDAERKVIKAYAYCVHPLKKSSNRRMLAPRIGDPVNGYTTPRHKDSPSSWRTSKAREINEHIVAYRIFMAKSQAIAEDLELSDMERVIMAKCISEQALRFFKPTGHPLTAIKESARLYTRSPERAFFKERGVCNNFCAITFNIAQDLGVGQNLRLAHRHFHSYLELKVGKQWYHTHPFSSASESDFIRIGPAMSTK